MATLQTKYNTALAALSLMQERAEAAEDARESAERDIVELCKENQRLRQEGAMNLEQYDTFYHRGIAWLPRDVVIPEVRALQSALDAERAKRRSIERAVRAWADESNHPAMDCPECMALYDIANGRA